MPMKRFNKYKKSGIKLTPQRLAIFDYLEGNIDHPSADDIYKAVQKAFPTMSFATVYTTLETLRQLGMLAELTIDAGKKRFDPNTERHHHLICTGCSKVVDVHRDFCLDLPAGFADGFEVTGNHIEFYGTCPACGTKNINTFSGGQSCV
jgi:Fur family transcriptional regulator, peroxide stress response regulator